ncbi:hypothetical protein OUZ56_020337 [Daphnia magna]|uniref:Uncharacterized protein n=1 Tax=Daphnia magna TaxID=35525 RepID=A0ABQ9ZEH2_9CRUS|nr:hypothetical protein OUZ56_020337 [Daphnia magna]
MGRLLHSESDHLSIKDTTDSIFKQILNEMSGVLSVEWLFNRLVEAREVQHRGRRATVDC